MLENGLVRQIIDLHEQGVSQREVAKRLDVARETVRKIVHGLRPDYTDRKLEHFDFEDCPLMRCGECGALVYAPCYACIIRKRADLTRSISTIGAIR